MHPGSNFWTCATDCWWLTNDSSVDAANRRSRPRSDMFVSSCEQHSYNFQAHLIRSLYR